MLQRLASHGFTLATVLNDDGRVALLRIRTSKGWVYERFPSDNPAAVDAWAARHMPGTA